MFMHIFFAYLAKAIRELHRLPSKILVIIITLRKTRKSGS